MSFARLALTQSANFLGLTPALVGFVLARALGLGPAVGSIVLACAMTCALACGSACLAVAYRAPTAALSARLLGPAGPRLVGAALGLALCGWFGVHIIALGQAVPELLGQAPCAVPPWPLVLACAAVSLLVVRHGNARIAAVNSVQGPLLLLAVAAAAWPHRASLAAGTLWPALGIDWGSVAMVVAAGLGDVVDMPTVLHRAHSRAAAMGAAAVSYGLVLPLLLVMGALLAQDGQAPTALAVMADGPAAWRVAVCALGIGSACLGNAGVLFSGGLSLAAAAGRRSHFGWRLATAALATGLALTPLSAHLPQLLDLLAIATGAVGASLLVHFVCDGGRPAAAPALRRQQASALGAMLAAVGGLITFAWLEPAKPGMAVAVATGGAALLAVLVRAWLGALSPAIARLGGGRLAAGQRR